MTNYIQDNAKDASGKWDIATIPGGGGNWGGSYLTVPAQGDNIEEAKDDKLKGLLRHHQDETRQQIGNLEQTAGDLAARKEVPTFDTGAWFASASWLALAFVLGLAVYGLRTALAGRPMFSSTFLHE